MATLATMCNRLMGREVETAPFETPASETFRLRAFPNEDIYFVPKPFDNTRIVRERDPQAGSIAWRSFALTGSAVLLVIGALLPPAYSKLAGYQIQQLRQEQERLLRERDVLELEMAQQLSPTHLQELADRQDFVPPAAENVFYLEPKSEGSLAMNKR